MFVSVSTKIKSRCALEYLTSMTINANVPHPCLQVAALLGPKTAEDEVKPGKGKVCCMLDCFL